MKKLLGLNENLKVSWQPGGDRVKLGEVRGMSIFIYAEALDQAIETLDHEVLDFRPKGSGATPSDGQLIS